MKTELKAKAPWEKGLLKVAEDGRHFCCGEEPFFLLGDTAWLLFHQLTLEESYVYLRNRKDLGYNVILADFIHTVDQKNLAGDSALTEEDPARPNTEGSFWTHVDAVMEMARELGLYMGILPVWGSSVVKSGRMNMENVDAYMDFVLNRYHDFPNIIWVVGGDVRGDVAIVSMQEWDDNTAKEEWFGEDSWKYVKRDLEKSPVRPVLDGEPSYEWIRQGLHDNSQPYWKAADVRRYAYWSVFAGAAGHVYGHNSIMQFYKDASREGAYGAKYLWSEAIHHPGGAQMVHLKKLCERVGFEKGHPAQEYLLSEQGEKYDYISVLAGDDFLLAYTVTGRPIALSLKAYGGRKLQAYWMDPVTGMYTYVSMVTGEEATFNPPEREDGTDVVLVLLAEG